VILSCRNVFPGANNRVARPGIKAKVQEIFHDLSELQTLSSAVKNQKDSEKQAAACAWRDLYYM